jgi:hypothetical protein
LEVERSPATARFSLTDRDRTQVCMVAALGIAAVTAVAI